MLYQLPLVAGFTQQALVLGEAAEARESCEESLTALSFHCFQGKAATQRWMLSMNPRPS